MRGCSGGGGVRGLVDKHSIKNEELIMNVLNFDETN